MFPAMRRFRMGARAAMRPAMTEPATPAPHALSPALKAETLVEALLAAILASPAYIYFRSQAARRLGEKEFQ